MFKNKIAVKKVIDYVLDDPSIIKSAKKENNIFMGKMNGEKMNDIVINKDESKIIRANTRKPNAKEKADSEDALHSHSDTLPDGALMLAEKPRLSANGEILPQNADNFAQNLDQSAQNLSNANLSAPNLSNANFHNPRAEFSANNAYENFSNPNNPRFMGDVGGENPRFMPYSASQNPRANARELEERTGFFNQNGEHLGAKEVALINGSVDFTHLKKADFEPNSSANLAFESANDVLTWRAPKANGANVGENLKPNGTNTARTNQGANEAQNGANSGGTTPHKGEANSRRANLDENEVNSHVANEGADGAHSEANLGKRGGTSTHENGTSTHANLDENSANLSANEANLHSTSGTNSNETNLPNADEANLSTNSTRANQGTDEANLRAQQEANLNEQEHLNALLDYAKSKENKARNFINSLLLRSTLGAGYGALANKDDRLIGAMIGALAGAGGVPLALKAAGKLGAKANYNQNLREAMLDLHKNKGWRNIDDSFSGLIKRNFSDTLGGEYRELESQMNANINKQIYHLQDTFKSLSNLSEDARREAHLYLSGELDKSVNLEPNLKAQLDNLRKSLDDNQRTLYELGRLERPAEADEITNSWLHRIYDKNKDGNFVFASEAKTIEDIKTRGKVWKLNEEDFIKQINSGKIDVNLFNKPLYEGGSRATKTAQGKIELRRDWTFEERTKMGEIRDVAQTLQVAKN